jgi:hypothetical protein
MVIILESINAMALDKTAKELVHLCQGYAIPLPKRNGKSVRKVVGEDITDYNLSVMVPESVQVNIKS